MEPDMAVELFTKNELFEEAGVYASVIIGDDDSSTVAGVRRNATHEIEKWSDFNHTLKSFTSALYSMKLSPKLIEYFSRCFSSAVKQNKGNTEKVRAALEAIVPHAFGDHQLCGDWCKSHVNNNYKHNNLPHGKPLADEELREKLHALLSRFARNAEKIAPCGCTQANESLNNAVASKTPKARHYSASESLHYRVATSVCQKNDGYTYIAKVYNKLLLSPGSARTLAYRLQKDKKREIRAKLSKTKEIKKRRLYAKKQRSIATASRQRQEGLTYESGVSCYNVSDLFENTPRAMNDPNNFENDNYRIVYFDLETTGLRSTDQICQIAAYDGVSTFNAYITPSIPISRSASAITGMQIIDGDMYVHEDLVQTIPVRAAVDGFLKYLEEISGKENRACQIILLSHNGFKFDVPRILSLIVKLGVMETFKKTVSGFADTLDILRNALPERRKNKQSFS
ncbi:uncharacterized protein LOC112467665, partial [Temnothorax curvispinosus]